MRKLGALPHGWLGAIASDDAGDPRPFLIPGVRVRFDPIGRKAVRAARAACGATLKATADLIEASDALTREMLRLGIVEWEGVGGADGSVVEVAAETVNLFIADTDLCEAAEEVYVRPWLVRDTEKNDSAASSNGTSEAGMPADDTATKSASGEQTGDASPIRKPKTKKPGSGARTSRTTSEPRKRKASSTS